MTGAELHGSALRPPSRRTFEDSKFVVLMVFYTTPSRFQWLWTRSSGLESLGVHFNGLRGSREAPLGLKTHFFALPTRGRVRCTLTDGALRSERLIWLQSTLGGYPVNARGVCTSIDFDPACYLSSDGSSSSSRRVEYMPGPKQ